VRQTPLIVSVSGMACPGVCARRAEIIHRQVLASIAALTVQSCIVTAKPIASVTRRPVRRAHAPQATGGAEP